MGAHHAPVILHIQVPVNHRDVTVHERKGCSRLKFCESVNVTNEIGYKLELQVYQINLLMYQCNVIL